MQISPVSSFDSMATHNAEPMSNLTFRNSHSFEQEDFDETDYGLSLKVSP